MAIELPEHLREAILKRKCILFVGSGLSVAAGYPTWSDLVRRLAEETQAQFGLSSREIKRLLKNKDYLTLASLARAKLGTSHYAEILDELFSRPVRPTRAHEVIARTDYRGIITTNYDRLIETTITLTRGWAPHTFTPGNISALADALYNPKFFIFKLHGDVDLAPSIVLTSQDYDQLMFRNIHVRVFMQAVFLNYTLLFVGYSLSDPDFQLLLTELTLIFENYTPRHYALIPDAGELTVEHLLERLNIQTIPYSPQEDHREAAQFLERIQAESPYNSSLTS